MVIVEFSLIFFLLFHLEIFFFVTKNSLYSERSQQNLIVILNSNLSEKFFRAQF